MMATHALYPPQASEREPLQKAIQQHAFQLPAARHWPDLSWHELLLDQLVCSGRDEQNKIIAIGVLVPEQQMVFLSVEQSMLLQHPLIAELLQWLAAEATRFGLHRLLWRCALQHINCLQQMGFRPVASIPIRQDSDNAEEVLMHRSLSEHLQPWQSALLALCAELDIDSDYGARHRLRLQNIPRDLIDIGIDCFQRPQQATAATARAWQTLQQAAANDDVTLQLVSAWRSYHQQANIIRRKLAAGQSLEAALRVSAAPGFSEHHSGRALDLNTAGCPPLETDFASTQAYAWLCDNATAYGFVESYPQHNHHGIAWEPWHWCLKP